MKIKHLQRALVLYEVCVSREIQRYFLFIYRSTLDGANWSSQTEVWGHALTLEMQELGQTTD